MHHDLDRHRTAIGQDLRRPGAADLEAAHLGVHDLAAAAHQVGGQRRGQAKRIDGAVDVGQRHRLDDLGRQRRLHLPRLVAVEDVHVHAVAAPEIERVGGALEGGLALEGHHQALVADPMAGVGALDQRRIACMRVHQQAVARGGDGLDARRPRGLDEAQEPRQRPGHVTPAQLQRRIRVEQHARHLLQHAGHGEGHAGGGAEAAGIAERRRPARLALLDEPDLEAFALQVKRATDADDAGADHGDGFVHQLGENDTVDGISSMPSVFSDSRMRVSLRPSPMFHSAQRLRNFCQRASSSSRMPM